MIKLRVKEILKKQGVSQKELSDRLGITEVGLSKSLSEKGNPTKDTLEKIAEALNVEIWELFVESTGKSEFMALVKDKDNFYSTTTLQELEELVERLKAEKK